MGFGAGTLLNRASRGWIIRALLAVFVLRALVPVGFMPDVEAAAKGVFKVVICSAYGAKTIALDAEGNPVKSPSTVHHDQPCAFSGLAVATLQIHDAALILAPALEVEAPVPPLAVVLPPTRAGPPLGSRGPPLFS